MNAPIPEWLMTPPLCQLTNCTFRVGLHKGFYKELLVDHLGDSDGIWVGNRSFFLVLINMILPKPVPLPAALPASSSLLPFLSFFFFAWQKRVRSMLAPMVSWHSVAFLLGGSSMSVWSCQRSSNTRGTCWRFRWELLVGKRLLCIFSFFSWGLTERQAQETAIKPKHTYKCQVFMNAPIPEWLMTPPLPADKLYF